MKPGWKEVALGQCCTFRRGLTYAKGDEVVSSSNAVLRANNIDLESNTLNFNDMKFIRDEISVPQSKKVQRGSLLLCTASGSKSHLGKVALIDEDLDMAFGGFMGLLVPSDELLPKFFFYLCISDGYLDFIAALSDGMNINNLKFDNLSEFRFAFPPLPEQERIVAILDEAFANIAIAKANTETALETAGKMVEAELESIFEKGHPSWNQFSMTEICSIDSKLVDPRDPAHQNLLHVGAGNIESKTGELNGLMTAREEGLISGKFRFDKTTVLYSKIRPYLMKVARPNFEGLCSADMYPLTPNLKVITRGLLFHLLLSRSFTRFAIEGSARAGMPKVNRDHLFGYHCALPPIEKQDEISAKLDSLCEHSAQLVEILGKKLLALDELKKSLLHQAFSGQL